MLNAGDSLVGYTVGTQVTVASGGNPNFCINVASFIYKDYGNVSNQKSFYFDIKLGSGYTNVVLEGTSAGVGPTLHFSAVKSECYFAPALTGWSDPSSSPVGKINFNSSFAGVVAGTWYSFRVDFDWVSNKLRVVQIVSGAEVEILAYIAFISKGSIFGFGKANGTNIGVDNFGFQDLVPVTGSALLNSGAPATQVQLYDWTTHLLYAVVTPGSDGSYGATVERGDYLVVATGPAGYRPVAHKVTAG